MRPSLIRNYLLISLGITALFVLLGAFVLNFLERERRHEFESNHSIFFARLIDEASPQNKDKFLDEIKSKFFFSDIWILNSDGTIKDKNTDKPLSIDIKKNEPSKNIYEAIQVRDSSFPGPPITIVTLKGPEPKYMIFGPRRPPMGGGPGLHETHGPPPPGEMGDRPPPPPPGEGPMGHEPPALLFPFAILLSSILLASLVSVLVLFMYLKRTSALADSVIGNLKAGNLKARFPIERMNEVGRLMNRFNLMAEEIESLFEKLKAKERTRIQLLQELAHDLRTPLASLTNMLDTMNSNIEEIPLKTKREMLDLSLRETGYLAKLVEDLLLLSQISDPSLESPKESKHNLIDIIEGELEKLDSIYSNSEKQITIINQLGHNPIYFLCDLQMMTRLFRNVFDNAFAFAKSEIKVSIEVTDQKIQLSIQNDGAGFSPTSLSHYGERKVTRIIQGSSKERISVGLGSVIIKAIAQIHHIEVTPLNLVDERGQIKGAEISLLIKKGDV